MLNPHRTIRKPLITEKNMHKAETRNEYTFAVNLKANKIQIRQSVESLFNVKVLRVRTSIKKGLLRRHGLRWSQSPSLKKAVVKLAEGYKIDLI